MIQRLCCLYKNTRWNALAFDSQVIKYNIKHCNFNIRLKSRLMSSAKNKVFFHPKFKFLLAPNEDFFWMNEAAKDGRMHINTVCGQPSMQCAST